MTESDDSEKTLDPKGAVVIETEGEDNEPFALNPVYISLGLPLSAFQAEVGGKTQ